MSSELPERGEIWLTALGAVRAGEPGKTRPAVVLSPSDLLTDSARDLVVVVPLSASVSASPLRPVIDRASGLDQDSVAVTRAIRGIARKRLHSRIGELSSEELRSLDSAVGQTLGLNVD